MRVWPGAIARSVAMWLGKQEALRSILADFAGTLMEVWPGAIARSVAMSLRNQEALRSILASGTSFREDLVMKLFLRPFFLFR